MENQHVDPIEEITINDNESVEVSTASDMIRNGQVVADEDVIVLNPNKKKRKRTSPAWEYFEDVIIPPPKGDGKERARCKKCRKVYMSQGTYGTKNLNDHIKKCPLINGKDIQQMMLSGSEGSMSLRSSKFDPQIFREKITKAIVRHNLPFTFVEYEGIRDAFAYINPDVKLVSRNTAKADILKMYNAEKELLKKLLELNGARISLTADLWTSIATDGYLCMTAHFVDFDWKLQSRILSFPIVPTPHNGVNLCEKIYNILSDWGIDKKLFSITLDNASANDVFVEYLKNQLNLKDALLCEGNFFHVRCCAHVLNLIVQDGIKEIDGPVSKIRDSIKYVKGSQGRKQKFTECVAQVNLQAKKGLRNDVPTRWNSTFLMLESALFYRRAFLHLQLCDNNYKSCPSSEEWERVEKLSKFLGVFYDVTVIFSGKKYATTNLYFPRVFLLQFTLIKGMNDSDMYIRQMATGMYAKFNKYWSVYSPLLAIACILDPRYKVQFVEYAYKTLYGEVHGSSIFQDVHQKLFSLFENYVSPSSSNVISSSGSGHNLGLDSTSSHGYSSDFFDVMKGFDTYECQELSTTQKSQLEMYLDEPKLDRNVQLDVLDYWKANQFRYNEVANMVRDIFAVPISTVASESAFSIGGKVLDEERSSLKPSIVEALICTRDWVYQQRDEPQKKLEDVTEDIFSSNTKTNESVASSSIND